MKTAFFNIIFCILLLYPVAMKSQQANPADINKELITNNSFRVFEDDELLEFTLTFDLNYYLDVKPEDNIDAILSYHFSEKDSINKLIKLKARGNFRYRTCMFPPLRLDFSETNFGFTDLDQIENIKLVSHCDSTEIFEEYMLKEYLVYKLLNIVTDKSFRVRLLKINYRDINDGANALEHYAFALEPMDVLLARLGGTEIEDSQPDFNTVDRSLAEKISIFQYMIGNSDWNLNLLHNIKSVKPVSSGANKLVFIPYDFDYCGFVNAHYAIARTDLGIETVRDRVYLGPCINEDRIAELIDDFNDYRDEFLETIRKFEYLERSKRRDLEKYIISFFDEIRKDEIIESIKRNCINK